MLNDTTKINNFEIQKYFGFLHHTNPMQIAHHTVLIKVYEKRSLTQETRVVILTIGFSKS